MPAPSSPVHPKVRRSIEPLRKGFEGRRVMVTGGLGFIGSSVVQQLAFLGAEILDLDKGTYAANPRNVEGLPPDAKVTHRRVDVADSEAVRRAWRSFEPEAVIHLAAETHVDRSIEESSPFVGSNVLGSWTLLNTLRTEAVAPEVYLHCSTDEVYGDLADGRVSAGEAAPLRPSNPYSASKAGADLAALSFIRTYGLPIAVSRGSNSYGPRQFPEKLIPLMLANAVHRKPLPVYGDGGQVRDWLFVDDHAAALLRIAASYPKIRGRPLDPASWAVFNVGTGRETKNIELLKMLLGIVADSVKPRARFDELWRLVQHVEDRPGHDRRYSMDTKHLRDRIGWKPEVALEDGLRATVDWYQNNADWVEGIAKGTYQHGLEKVYLREARGRRGIARA